MYTNGLTFSSQKIKRTLSTTTHTEYIRLNSHVQRQKMAYRRRRRRRRRKRRRKRRRRRRRRRIRRRKGCTRETPHQECIRMSIYRSRHRYREIKSS
jgi:hypothetical protein